MDRPRQQNALFRSQADLVIRLVAFITNHECCPGFHLEVQPHDDGSYSLSVACRTCRMLQVVRLDSFGTRAVLDSMLPIDSASEYN